MNVQEILGRKIGALPVGCYSDGLAAVKAHIDAAVRHFGRAQAEGDEALFTDTIFRCNHAFEGSIKEAYRVLAEKDPEGKRTFDIEQFLLSEKLLRKRVLDQFTNYRQEWRNPSTHDYTMDFDEDEALLAIVSVTVFAIVLCDQIEGKIAFQAAAASTPATDSATTESASLLDLVTNAVQDFALNHVDLAVPLRSPAQDYYRLEGELAGYLSAKLSSIDGIVVTQNQRMSSREADVVVSRNGQAVIVELKRVPASASVPTTIQRAVTQAAFYLHEPNVTGAVAFVYSSNTKEYHVALADGPLAASVRVVAPIRERSRSN
jgi:hypothetical protein